MEKRESHRLLRFFKWAHLPPELQAISKPCGELAELVDKTLPDGSEKTAGLWKLLEAKDCFVRARLKYVPVEPGDPNYCPGPRACHGPMKWCDLCGDVSAVCDDPACDQHPRDEASRPGPGHELE